MMDELSHEETWKLWAAISLWPMRSNIFIKILHKDSQKAAHWGDAIQLSEMPEDFYSKFAVSPPPKNTQRGLKQCIFKIIVDLANVKPNIYDTSVWNTRAVFSHIGHVCISKCTIYILCFGSVKKQPYFRNKMGKQFKI